MKSTIEIEGPKASCRVKSRNKAEFIVKAHDNESDPMCFIHILKFDEKKKSRKALMGVTGTFSGAKKNDVDYVDYTAKKYGEKSYYLTTKNLQPGEYGIIVTNPNSLDEKQTVVNCFGVD